MKFRLVCGNIIVKISPENKLVSYEIAWFPRWCNGKEPAC